jgi:hypothetical protein
MTEVLSVSFKIDSANVATDAEAARKLAATGFEQRLRRHRSQGLRRHDGSNLGVRAEAHERRNETELVLIDADGTSLAASTYRCDAGGGGGRRRRLA